MYNVFKNSKNSNGFIALIFILIVFSILLLVTVTTSLRSAENMQSSLWQDNSKRAYHTTRGCIEDGLLNLKKIWQNYAEYQLCPDINCCTIEVNVIGNTATLQATGNFQYNYADIIVTIDDNFTILNWQGK